MIVPAPSLPPYQIRTNQSLGVKFDADFFQRSAVVVENRETWFADDNGLTKELCADPQENEDEQPEINEPCCACDEAKYEVEFPFPFNDTDESRKLLIHCTGHV